LFAQSCHKSLLINITSRSPTCIALYP